MIHTEVICDSISPQGKRLTTFKLRYPKFIHGEFMTHRVISRNASSSRAIPTGKLIEEVRSDELRAAPVFWGKNQKGMQAAEELSGVTKSPVGVRSELDHAQRLWADTARFVADQAQEMSDVGVHKQIVNRLLEPFSHINVVATATEWDNFFGLRLHKDAQPEMRALAVAMWEARKASTPKELKPGEWHLPYADDLQTKAETIQLVDSIHAVEQVRTRVSVARCARTSYESFETGKRSTVEEDLKLYNRLLAALKDPTQPLHASPAEHQGTPDHQQGWDKNGQLLWQRPLEHGNFVGWRQYRKMLPGEAVAPLPEEYRA